MSNYSHEPLLLSYDNKQLKNNNQNQLKNFDWKISVQLNRGPSGTRTHVLYD
nr:MAG TPA: hypothetical protein [Caudoviricetes sp.]